MAISEAFTSSSSTIGTNEFDLPNANTTISVQTSDGIYQAFLDLNNLETGDEFRFRIYEKAVAPGTQRVVQEVVFSNAQNTEPVYVTPALTLLHGWTMTIKKNVGGDRIIPYSIRKVA